MKATDMVQGLPKERVAGASYLDLKPWLQELQDGLARALQSSAPGGGSKVDVIPSSLWDEDAQLAEAREKSGWHEKMARREAETNEKLQARSWPCCSKPCTTHGSPASWSLCQCVGRRYY